MSATTTLEAPESGMTSEIMVQRAIDMIPTLRARATDTEQLRTLSKDTIADHGCRIGESGVGPAVEANVQETSQIIEKLEQRSSLQ